MHPNIEFTNELLYYLFVGFRFIAVAMHRYLKYISLMWVMY